MFAVEQNHSLASSLGKSQTYRVVDGKHSRPLSKHPRISQEHELSQCLSADLFQLGVLEGRNVS